MQAVKDKLGEISAMRKAKAELKAEERAEKDLAKARAEVAHEVRLAREAEAKMDLHVQKAAEVAEREIAKHEEKYGSESIALNVGAKENPYDSEPDPFGSATTTTTNASTTGPEYLTNTTGAPPPLSNNQL